MVDNDFLNKITEDDWHTETLGRGNSYLLLFRTTKSKDFLTRLDDKKRRKADTIGVGDDEKSTFLLAKLDGVKFPYGTPKGEADPALMSRTNFMPPRSGKAKTTYFKEANSYDLPEPGNISSYQSLMYCRPQDPSLVIAYDSEWENLPDERRTMLSWQFACLWDYKMYEFVFVRMDPDAKDLSLTLALGYILDTLRNESTDKTIRRIDKRTHTVYHYCVDVEDGDEPETAHYVTCTTKDASEARRKAKYICQGHYFHPRKISDMPDRYKKRSERDWEWYYSDLDLKDEKKLPITLLCHAGIFDMTAFDRDSSDYLMRQLSEVQGGLVTIESPTSMMIPSPQDRYSHYIYPCRITVRDTMCHAPAGRKSLANLGKVVGWEKIDLSEGTKEHMQQLLNEDPNLYLRYASNDCIVTLLYAAAMYGYNNCPPVTLTSGASKYAQAVLSQVYETEGQKDFLARVRLLRKVVKGKEPMENRPGFIEYTNLEPLSLDADIILRCASRAYSGGYNICTEIGYFPFTTHDYDLQSAYPTAMCLVPGINAEDPIAIEIRSEHWDKNTIHKYWDTIMGPFRPFVGYIRFRFPDDCPYCCFSVNVDGVPVFPRTSDGCDGIYVTGIEIYLALRLGAEIDVVRGFFLNPLYDKNETILKPLGVVQKGLIQDRKRAKQQDGKKSLTELALKTMSNSLYGKTAQNVIQKDTWSCKKDQMEDLGPSPITQPVWASLITAAVRCMLIATQNELTVAGYDTYSVTTDGMITNAPPDIIENLNLYGLAQYFRQARIYLTDGVDPSIWEEKHTQNDLVNLTTRVNISADTKGVLAHGGIKTPFPKGSAEDRLWFLDQTLSRSGRIVSKNKAKTNLKDYVHGAEFAYKTETRRVSVDYDMKRKPVKDTIATDIPSFGGKYYEIAHVKTVPYEDIAEYKRYRSLGQGMSCLRTNDEWNKFFAKRDCKDLGLKTQIHTDLDFTILMSCIMGYRAGMWDIAPLDNLSVEGKINYINKHNTSHKMFKKTDWKNARRPERQANMLPQERIAEKLSELQNS